MNKLNLILIGGGGHCKSCIDVIEHEGRYNIVGILDLPQKIGEKILGYEIFGSDDDILKYHDLNYVFLVTLGQIKSATIRKNIFDKLEAIGAKIATIKAPTAFVSNHALIGKGTIVMHNAFVNAGVKIGKNNIINSGCNIEHDVVIGDHCHISTQTVVNGDCEIGSCNFIGSNSTIVNQIKIGDNVVIGAGSMVNKDLDSNKVAFGVPAKAIKEK